MNRDIAGIVNNISAKDRTFGHFSLEAYECFEEGKHMPALASLFLLIEQAIKFSLELDEEKITFHRLLREAKAKKIIPPRDFTLLDKLREIRNSLFHHFHHSHFYKDSREGLFYPRDESDSWGKIFEVYAPRCFKIINKLL